MSTLSGLDLATSETASPLVQPSSYLTLHFRLATRDGTEIMSTFNARPATLQLGMGQLASALEQHLIGLAEGACQTFELAPEQAYGLRNPDLIQPVSLSTLQQDSPSDEPYKVGDLVELVAPAGDTFSGVLRHIDTDSALLDFNHPLAGQEITFEVKIIGIL